MDDVGKARLKVGGRSNVVWCTVVGYSAVLGPGQVRFQATKNPTSRAEVGWHSSNELR